MSIGGIGGGRGGMVSSWTSGGNSGSGRIVEFSEWLWSGGIVMFSERSWSGGVVMFSERSWSGGVDEFSEQLWSGEIVMFRESSHDGLGGGVRYGLRCIPFTRSMTRSGFSTN